MATTTEAVSIDADPNHAAGVQHGAGDDAALAVSCRGAGKRFGDTWVVRGLDLQLEAGTILGLIGPSGCGKTTTVRLINGVYRPDEGGVTVFGAAPSTLPNARRTMLGYLPQRPVLFEDLSLWENLNFHASLNGVGWRGRRRRLHDLLELVDLHDDAGKLVRRSSGGMQRRLALAATLVHEPPLLLLDEPTAGIDPILRQRFWDHFRAMRDRGHTVVVTTQYVGEAARCDLVGLLAEGAMAALGGPDELRRAAYGGALIDVETDRLPDERALTALCEVPGVLDATLVSARNIRVTVEDAGAALPAVVQHLQGAGLGVVDAGEVTVDYDDVFIRLVGRAQS